MHDISMDICQPKITSLISVSRLLMVETHQMENGGMQIMNMNLVLDSVVTIFVGPAVADARRYSATSQEHGVAVGIMVTTRGARLV